MDSVVAKRESNQVIAQYNNMINSIDFSKNSNVREDEIIEVLLYRDALQALWESECGSTSLDKSSKEEFIHLSKALDSVDQQLKDASLKIMETTNLEKWRDKVKPSQEAWWWYLESEAEKRSLWYKFDWIWNILTGIALAISASFMVSIYSAVSMSDANFATALSTIAQILGLAAIGGGALSSTGQEMVKNILSSLHISRRFFAEATFVISFIFMYGAYYVNNNLDNYYYDNGIEAYSNGELSDAIGFMLQAKEMNPDGTHYDSWIGKAYESLGNLDQASNYYLQSVENGNFEDLNSLGRVHINKINPITAQTNPHIAESYLLLALQRLQTYDNSEELMYKVRTNMGWALLNQQKYERAKSYLNVAMDRYHAVESLQTKKDQSNMAFCFAAQLEEEQNNTKRASKLWLECIEKARPEFVHQYNWFMKIKKERIAYCVDTSFIVSGFKEKRNDHAQKFCDNVKDDLRAKVLLPKESPIESPTENNSSK
jgi:tetratricopeptide (TPR) repeat protein